MKLFISFLFLFSSLVGFSQKVWDLDACIAYALEHSLDQQLQELDASINKEYWQQSKRNLLPNFNLSLPGYGVSYGRRIDPVTNTIVDTRFVSVGNGSLSGSLVLFESFRKWNSLAYQKMQYKSGIINSKKVRYDLAFRIMQLYSRVLFDMGSLELIKERQTANQLYYKTVKSRVELGLMAKADLYEVEATISDDNLSVLQAENNLRDSKLALLQEMNLDETDIVLAPDFDIRADELKAASYSNDHLFNKARQFLPELLMDSLAVKAAHKQVAINRASFFPSISLSGNLGTGYSPNLLGPDGETLPFREQLDRNQFSGFYFSLNVPVFGNGRIRSSVKISRLNHKKSLIRYDKRKQLVQKDIQNLLQKNRALIAEEQLNQKRTASKALAYTIAKKKFEKNLASLYELQTASNAYLMAQIEQVRLKTQIAIQKRTLDFYNGTFVLPTLTTSNQ